VTGAAAGVHLPWAQVPDRVQHWAAAVGGAPPNGVIDLHGGFSPGAAARLGFPSGPDIFVKAVGAALNPESPKMHRREGEISAAMPASSFWPRLLDTYDDGDWVALAFEASEGRAPAHPWLASELQAVLRALERMHGELTPSPSPTIESAVVRRQSMFGGWRALASADTSPFGLDDWSQRNLDGLADLESAWPEACVGSSLLHGDIRSDNILVEPGGTGVVFVDWPHAAVGTPALDVVCWAPSVVLEGGPEPEVLLAGHGPSRETDPDAVTAMLAAVAGFFTAHSLRPPPPGLPTLRAFQAAQGQVARDWLQRRTGW
jgi:hypothetical protein